jgi:uncharacterized membrane protein
VSTDIATDRAAVRDGAAASGLFALARREAWRMLTSPAVAVLAVYFVVVGGVESVTDFSNLTRAMFAEILEVLILMFVALAVFPAVHLTATSARRAGAEAQLAATPTDALRRDMSLCLGVLLGPVALALALALLGAWVATGVVQGPLDEPQIDPWTATDVLQWPALAMGAGILAVVVARWLRFPGSLLLGFVGMVFVTVWTVGEGGTTIPWLSWFTVNSSNSPVDTVLVPSDSIAWHTAYLFSWSVVGVCAVGLRQSERRRSWLIAIGLAAALVVATGLLQLPSYPVRLFQ